jgi:hypothetical protein
LAQAALCPEIFRTTPWPVVTPLECSAESAEYLARKRSEMRAVPRFGDEYTIREGVTEAMRAEMNQRMVERFGYIV